MQLIAGTLGTLVTVAALAFVLGPKIGDAAHALSQMTVWSIVALIGAGLIPMLLRAEAFRISLHARGSCTTRPDVHAASGLTFCAAEVNHYAARAVRAGVLRKLGCGGAQILHLLAAEIPVLLMEGAVMAVILCVAAALLGWAWWLVAALCSASLCIFAGVQFVQRRWPDSSIGAGLSALRSPRLTAKLCAIAVCVLLVQILRTYVAMRAVGIHLDVQQAALAFVCVAGLGTLPLGPSAAPSVSLAFFASANGMAVAAAGGLVLTMSAALAAVGYASFMLLWISVRRVTRQRRDSAEKVSAQKCLAPLPFERVAEVRSS
jgi:hypothetical protein